MVIQYKTINKVRFPVYVMPNYNWDKQDGLLFLEGQIIDDSNMSGDTLGIRRLQTSHKNLFPLRHQIDNFRGLLKCGSNTFVDTNGTPFIYEKSEFCSLKYYKIQSVQQKETASVLTLQNVKTRFVVPRPPAPEARYAGVLHYGRVPWVLYEYSETLLKDTRRKV